MKPYVLIVALICGWAAWFAAAQQPGRDRIPAHRRGRAHRSITRKERVMIHTMFASAAVVFFACALSAFADRALVHEAVVAAPVADVWKSFTTSEGFASWAVAHAEIDLRLGGDMRTHYSPSGVLGDDGTIINRIISFEPERMLSIRNVQAPKGFQNAELFQQTWSVIYFEPLAPDRTKVRVVGMGYGEGEQWDDIYNKFNAGNAHTLAALQKRFAPNEVPDDPARVMALLGKLAGGEWIHQGAPPGAPEGTVFRVRNVIERGPDGASLVMRGWLGDDGGMFKHAATLIWREPAGGGRHGVRFQNVDQNGAIASGGMRLVDRDRIEWDWNATALDGTRERYRVTMGFVADDRYTMRLDLIADDGTIAKLVDVEFQRVAQAPAEFLKLRAPATAPAAP